MKTFNFIVDNNSKIVNDRRLKFIHITISVDDKTFITPYDIPELINRAPPIPLSWGVVISGQVPAWVLAVLSHHYRYTAWVAVCDPRQDSAVVCQKNHETSPDLGTVIEL